MYAKSRTIRSSLPLLVLRIQQSVLRPKARCRATVQVFQKYIEVRMPAARNAEQVVLVRQAMMCEHEQHIVALL